MRRIGLALAVVGALAVGSGGVASAEPPGPSCVGIASRSFARSEPGARAEAQQIQLAVAKLFGAPPGALVTGAAQEHCIPGSG